MKIAFIVSEFPSLSETFILKQITGLMDLGHDVEIFAMDNPHDEIVHSDVTKYRLMEQVHYFFSDDVARNRLNRAIHALYLIIRNFHKASCKILKSLNISKYGINALSLFLLYATIRFLDKEFDIIHCHFGQNGITGAQLKEIGIRGKLITTFYGYDLTKILDQSGVEVYRSLVKHGDVFLPICNYFRDKLMSIGCDESKIVVHHLGADIGCFTYSERGPGPEQPLRFLTIGRLVEKKAHKYTLMAFSQVVKQNGNLEYIIAGTGPLRSELERVVNDLDLADHVTFTGAVSEIEVNNLLQNSHVFVLPSITAQDGDQEGTPAVLVEAQACGLPVIATYHSGIPELVIDGKSGFLVPEKDVDALAEKMKYLVEHPEIFPEMGCYGRRFVEEHFNIKTLNQQLVDIYHRVLKGESLPCAETCK